MYNGWIQSSSCLRESGWVRCCYFHRRGECKTWQINKKPLQAISVYDSKHTFIPDAIISAISNDNSQVSFFYSFIYGFIYFFYLFIYVAGCLQIKCYETCRFMMYFEIIVNVLFGHKYTLWQRALEELQYRSSLESYFLRLSIFQLPSHSQKEEL